MFLHWAILQTLVLYLVYKMFFYSSTFKYVCGRCKKLPSTVKMSMVVKSYLKDLEWAHERFIDRHHGAGVVKLSAVVGRAEQGDQLPLGEELVTVLHNLGEQWRHTILNDPPPETSSHKNKTGWDQVQGLDCWNYSGDPIENIWVMYFK